MAGRGHGADALAAAYAGMADSFLQLSAKCIMSIEGVIVGLTVTANNYQRADWASREANRRHRGEEPPYRSPPVSVGRTTYRSVSSIKWTGTGDDSGPILAWAGNGPDWLAGQIDEVVEHVLRLGKTVEITPGADTGELRAIGDAWLAASKAAKTSATNFTSCIAYLTDGGNSEWQGAMNSFCQSIWGTTAWGGSRGISDAKPAAGGAADAREWRTNPSESPANRRPIIEVLARTGETLHRAFHDAADAADKCRETTSRLATEAANATVKDLTVDLDFGELTRLGATLAFGEITATFAKHMDKAGADAAVEACHAAFHEAARAVKELGPELVEASWSAPTFAAEEARARAFGARARRVRTAPSLVPTGPRGPRHLRDRSGVDRVAGQLAHGHQARRPDGRTARPASAGRPEEGAPAGNRMGTRTAQNRESVRLQGHRFGATDDPVHHRREAGHHQSLDRAAAYEALALFQNDEDAMDRFFSQVFGGGSGSVDFTEFFPLLARSIIDHLATAHPPVWPKGD
ncbi:hypothetical protein OG413_08255 [Streptomyces sp. NBC_01433]|nr:hypothetical protein [Streptomyces sp. NBC_01433]MCX4675316.1 hypothetical protein [Streptomyces sp. NBC_01433]